LFFRIIGWLSVVALVLGMLIIALDIVVGIRIALFTPTLGVALFLGAFFVSGLVAAIETFFFRKLSRRERWLEYYRQTCVPLRAIEVLLSRRRRG
jgi:hypothetical protein